MTIQTRTKEFQKPEHELNRKHYSHAIHQDLDDIVASLEENDALAYTYDATRFSDQLKWLRYKYYKVTGAGNQDVYQMRQREKDEIDVKATKQDVYESMRLKFGDNIDQLLLGDERKHLLFFVQSCVGKRYKPPQTEYYFQEDFAWFANIYIPPKITQKQILTERPKLWQDYLNRFVPPEELCWDSVCEDVTEPQQDYLEKWVAHRIQHPDKPPHVALLLRGEQGTGKNFLTDYVLGVLLGKHNYVSVSLKDLSGNFNQHLYQSACVHV
jgi:hypothetical protein